MGAGLSGLAAARELAAGGASVLVLEARDRLSGRTERRTLGSGLSVELGGQWVGALHTELLGLIEELGLETFPTYDSGAGLFLGEAGLVRFDGETLGLPPESLAEISRLQEELEGLAATVPLAAPWTPDASPPCSAR